MAAAPAFTGLSFQSRVPAQPAPSATSYRNIPAADSSGSDSDSDEDAALWRRKRQKCVHPPPVPSGPAMTPVQPFGPTTTGTMSRKVNNIWGSIVQEQNQDVMAAELGIMGMEGDLNVQSRQSEAYNYVFARKMMERERELEREQQEQDETAMLDDQLEDYMKKGTSNESDCHLKRKRSAKERLGPRAEMDFQGRCEITADDPEEKVIDEIAHR